MLAALAVSGLKDDFSKALQDIMKSEGTENACELLEKCRIV